MKISIENYGQTHSTEYNHDDCTIEEYLDTFFNLLIANGFHQQTILHGIKELIEEKES